MGQLVSGVFWGDLSGIKSEVFRLVILGRGCVCACVRMHIPGLQGGIYNFRTEDPNWVISIIGIHWRFQVGFAGLDHPSADLEVSILKAFPGLCDLLQYGLCMWQANPLLFLACSSVPDFWILSASSGSPPWLGFWHYPRRSPHHGHFSQSDNLNV